MCIRDSAKAESISGVIITTDVARRSGCRRATECRQWGESAQPKAVAHHEHRAERHGRARDKRVEQAECGQWDGCDVVAERPKEVPLDRTQGRPAADAIR